MDRVTAYDDDIYAWSQEQAEALRRFASSRPDLPNDLDVANIAEEIEDVGSSELYRVESFLELLLIHLVKVVAVPHAPAQRHWQAEITLQKRSVAKHYRRSMRQNVDLDEIWERVMARADAALAEHGDAMPQDMPSACPFTLDELVARDFDPDRNARWAEIREAVAGRPLS